MKMIEQIITMVINIEFNITALATDFQSCQKICDDLGGYIPYLSEVSLIHNQLYINGSLARNKFSIFNAKRRIAPDDKKFRFFISTSYDYSQQIWKSGFFEIDKNHWDATNESDYQFPIEGDGFGCKMIQAIYCICIHQDQTLESRVWFLQKAVK